MKRAASSATKTEAVRRHVFRRILRGDWGPGDAIPTERDMAARTGTSRVTVRRAYATLADAGIVERVQGRGTRVSAVIRGNADETPHIALLTVVHDPFALAFIRAMERALTESDRLLVLKITEEDPVREESAAVELVEKGLRSMVVWPSGGVRADTFSRLRVLGANLVFFDRVLPGPWADFVGLDNARAVADLCAHALRSGRDRLVFVGHAGLDADSDREREDAFRAVAAEAGLPHEVVRVPWKGDIDGVLHAHCGAWFDPPDRTAAVCVNDAVALRVRAVAPPELAVYGVDGFPEATAAGVVTYAQPLEEMARIAIEMLAAQQRRGDRWTARRRSVAGTLVEPVASEPEHAGSRSS